MRLSLIVSILIATALSPVRATSFNFDLTPVVGVNLSTPFPEVEVDIGQEFELITATEFRINGTFQPGNMQAVGTEPNTNPLVLTDTVGLTIRVGEIGTKFFEKELFASQSLIGLEGDVELSLPLLEIDEPVLPAFVPAVHSPMSFDSMLDGKFGLSAVVSHRVASLYQVIDNPTFVIDQFTLHIEGIPVPEPSSLLTMSVALATASMVTARRSN